MINQQHIYKLLLCCFYPIKNVYYLPEDILLKFLVPLALEFYYCTVYLFIETFLLYKNEKLNTPLLNRHMLVIQFAVSVRITIMVTVIEVLLTLHFHYFAYVLHRPY